MLDLINEIESCISNSNLRCALGMALTLPDICAQIEFPGETCNEKRYIKWCEKYFFNQECLLLHKYDCSIPTNQSEKGRVIDPKMCYKLRCAFLHSGNLNLNQKEKDDYPVFTLQITSTKEKGVYIKTEGIIKNIDQDLKIEDVRTDISIDIRLLTRVLCNAAKKYYENSSEKEKFKDHHINIIDIEKEVNNMNIIASKFETIQNSKKNKNSYEELTKQAKKVLSMIEKGKGKEVSQYLLEYNNEYILAMLELKDSGFFPIK